MAGQEKTFEIAQAGLETVPGTAVAATRKWYVQLAPFTYTRELQWATNTTGTRYPRRTPSYRRPAHGFTGTEDLSFDDLPWVCQLLLKGGVTGGAGDAGTPPAYTWTFIPTAAAFDLKTATVEYGTPVLAYKANQVGANSATIRITPDDQANWQADYELMARKPTQTAMTASIGERTRELIRAPGTKLYIDAAGGTIGTTQLTGRFIGASLTITNNLNYKAFAEDEDDYAANKIGIGDFIVDAQITLEFDSDAEYADYRALATAGAPFERLIRLERSGTQIHGSSVVNKRVRFDMNGYWSGITPDYRETNKIITLDFQPGYNVANAYAFKAEIVNQLATNI
jgi:hypothetical protein